MATGDKIYLADKQTLDDVNAKVGVTTDTGGNATKGTIMGKLNALLTGITAHVANWTAAKAANLDAAVSSRESEANAASRYTTLNANTATNNTASATGTLSQKLSKVLQDISAINTSVAGNTKRLSSKKLIAKVPSKTSATLIDVNGAGVFYTGYISGNSVICKCTITIDDVEYILNNNNIDGTFGRVARYPQMFSFLQTGLFVNPTEFNKRFVVTVEAISTSNIDCYIDYSVYE